MTREQVLESFFQNHQTSVEIFRQLSVENRNLGLSERNKIFFLGNASLFFNILIETNN